MNSKALKVLEYNKIIDILEKEANSNMAKKLAKELLPYTDMHIIKEEIRSTTEAVDLIIKKGALPVGQIYDVTKSVNMATKGATLSMGELLHIHYNLAVTKQVVTFMKGEIPNVPVLSEMVGLLVTLPRLEENIDRCIISEDEMSDNASSELRSIRKNIVRQNETIRTKLNHIVSSQGNKTYLQDSIVTMRDGRYVVPIKQEHRGKVPGIVHDQSQTGATIFVEPQVIVNLNNELRELELAEKVEIQRILAELSEEVANEHFHINNNQELLVGLDFIMAKGKLSIKLSANAPTINETGNINIIQGRHPLIDPKTVVPISVNIGEKYKTLVITGPNTGGKTVSLKTIGLLTMMAQSGLHIPASTNSHISLFEDIFADIGDEQSIEQNLSTFSSHMKNIVNIVENSNKKTLVLLDELGAGTDPTEGAALAIAIIENIKENGATIIATTHYNEIKKYALSREDVENASMEFDINTLSPTYRLNIGIPGKSNAFEISKKLGLNGKIIDKANMLLEGKDIEFEDIISSIEKDKKAAEELRVTAERTNADIQQNALKLAKEKEGIEKQKQRIIADAREEARRILQEAKETSNEVQKELRDLNKVQSLGERNKLLAESKEKLRSAGSKYQEHIIKRVNNEPVDASKLKVGNLVKVLTLGQNGEVISLPDSKGNLQVKMGMIKAIVNLKDIMLLQEDKRKKAKTTVRHASLYKQKVSSISISINVTGKSLDDAITEVEKYVDDAIIAGLKQVTIIHGRGEGILKKGIREILKRNKQILEQRRGDFDEGGDGVTVVKFKE